MEDQTIKKVSRLRTAIPQILAVSAKNLILFDMGLCLAFPTIVIPAVQNSSKALSLNDEQTSWFGSISMICTPVGSIMSGLILERLGRKKSLMVVNVPLLLSWALFYFVNTPASLLATSAVMGLSMGLVEAPILTYVAEVSQPELRGMLTSFTELGLSIGMFCQYLIGTLTDWRNVAAISAAVPIISIVAITQVPESPAWLMSRGRTKEAERSLCWLRGWVRPAAVKQELAELERYYHQTSADARAQGLVNQGFTADLGSKADICDAAKQASSNEKIAVSGYPQNYDSILANFRAMLKPETLRPLIMVTVMSFLEHWSGITGTRPFMVQVFDEFGMPIDAHWTTVATGLLAICGMVVCLVAVPWCGKRPLLFLSVAGMVTCCTLLGTYAYLALPGSNEATSWMPLSLFITLFFTHSLALGPMPWMLLSEVFPFRTRSLAAGTAAALNYVLSFSVSKTFLELKARLGLYGVFWLYGALTALGSVYLMFEFKETEGKSLQDIENHYKKKLTLPLGKSKTSDSFPKVASNECNRSKDNVRDSAVHGVDLRAPFTDAVESARADLPNPDGQHRKNIVNQSCEDAEDSKSSGLPTAYPERDDGGIAAKDVSRENSEPSEKKEEKGEERGEGEPSAGGSSPATPESSHVVTLSDIGSEAESISPTKTAARRLLSLPGEAQAQEGRGGP